MELEEDAFLFGCKIGDIQKVEKFIDIIRPERRELLLDLGFSEACLAGHLNVLIYFSNRFSIDFYGLYFSQNCLGMAAEKGDLEMVKFFISQGAPVSGCMGYALRYSAERGHLEIVELLVENGADVFRYGNDALWMACEYGHLKVVEFLVEKGADPFCKDPYMGQDFGCLKIASEFGHLKVVKFLLGKGLPANNNFAISKACNNRHFEVAYWLWKAGANWSYLSDQAQKFALIYEKNDYRKRSKAAKKIYFWWIPICYSLEHPSGCGQRMAQKNLQKFLEMIM